MDDKKMDFSEEEKELRDKQVKLIKKLISASLEKISELEEQIKELQRKKRYLKMDVEDLKEGRIDRMLERHEADSQAKETSVFTVELVKKDKKGSPYYYPYAVYFNGEKEEVPITCSLARHYSIGTYKLNNGEIVHLR